MKKLSLFTTLLTFSFLLFLGTGCQQSHKPAPPAKQGQELIDSLRTALAKSEQDTNRVNALNGLAEHAGWRINQNDTCITYAQKALTLAQKKGYKYGIGMAYKNLGNGQSQKSEPEEALKSSFAALNIFKEIGNKKLEGWMYSNIANCYMAMNDYPNALKYLKAAVQPSTEVNDQHTIASAYSRIGNINTQQGNYNEALKSYAIVLNITQKINDKNWMAWAYNNIGGVYLTQGNYPKALKNFISDLKIAESIEDKGGMADGYVGLGSIYFSQGNYPEALKNLMDALKMYESVGDKERMANCYTLIGGAYRAQGNYPEALKNLKAALEICESIGDKYLTVNCYGNIGEAYQSQGNYPEALKNFMVALEISELIGSKTLIAYGYNGIGAVYTQMNNAREGKIWLQKSLALSKEIGIKDNMRNSYLSLAGADSAMGNFKSAFENYKLFVVYKDSLKNEENTKKLTQTSMQYEFDKKQLADSLKNVQVRRLAAEKLGKQKAYTALGAGLAFLLLAFSFFIFRNNKKLDKEKKKSENLLLNILPAEVAEELKEKGRADAKQFDEVSVLFTDFVHFTQTSAQLTPTQVLQELNECFTAFDNIIERNGLEKIKTIGDAYMAVCGLPISDSRHAQRTVQAALEIRDFIAERHQKEQTFEIRIGVNSGSVVAGIVGVKKFAYDIWGDTVNTASRMESSGEPGKVNISETTYQLIKEEFECTPRGKINAKGKGEVEMYFVEG